MISTIETLAVKEFALYYKKEEPTSYYVTELGSARKVVIKYKVGESFEAILQADKMKNLMSAYFDGTMKTFVENYVKGLNK